MSCPVFKTCLVYLSLCSISHGALIQTKFQRISNGNRTTDTVIRTVHRESQLLCGEACLADQECRGYHWSHEHDALLQHKCELLKYVHLPNILPNVSGVNLFVDTKVPCYNTSHCLGPFFPICHENECKLICEKHQIPTSDGNCTLSASFSNSKKSMTSIPWYNVKGEEPLDFIEIREDCLSINNCGILISLDKPPSRMFDFWPLKYNFWPSNMLYVRYSGEGKYTASTYSSDYASQTKNEYESYFLDKLKSPPHQLRVIVGKWNGIQRKVSVDVKVDSDKYLTIVATELQSTQLETPKLDYYLAFVHDNNSNRALTGPLYLKGVVNYIAPVETCSPSEDYLLVTFQPNTAEPTCVKKRSTSFMGSGSNRANFLDKRQKLYYDFKVEAKSTASTMEVALASGAETFDSSPFSPRATLNLKQSGSTTKMTFKFDRFCPSQASQECKEGTDIIFENELLNAINVFDGEKHNFNISYPSTTDYKSRTCAEDQNVTLASSIVHWSIVIDGVEVFPQSLKEKHVVKQECYKVPYWNRYVWKKYFLAVESLNVISFTGDGVNFTIGWYGVPNIYQG